MAANLHNFGSNGQDKADYSRGVLERFTRRAPKDWEGNARVSTIANPRKINYLVNPHFPIYFEGFYSVNEKGGVVQGPSNEPVTDEKMAMNHYHTKSREEYKVKKIRGIGDRLSGDDYSEEQFNSYDRNEEFDDGILKYREARVKTYQPPDKSHANERLLTALMKNLLPTLKPTPQDFYAGKMETFLTCRAVSSYLKTKLTDDAPAKFFEEASINAILKSMSSMTFADARLLIRELPNLLSLPYPVVNDLRVAVLNIIPQIKNIMRLNYMYKNFMDLDYLQDLLKLGG